MNFLPNNSKMPLKIVGYGIIAYLCGHRTDSIPAYPIIANQYT